MPIQKVTKDGIIRMAIEVFQKQGYHKTSMQDLADACNLRKGSFYYYFKSKEELMQEVLKSVHQYYSKKVFVVAYDKSLKPAERLKKIFKEQEPIITKSLGGCLFGNMTLETISVKKEFREQLKVFFSDWQAAFKELFLDAGHEEEIASGLSQQSVMEIEGAIMMMRLYNEKKLLLAACKRVLDRV